MQNRLALWGGSPVIQAKQHCRWPILETEERQAINRVLDRGILSGANAPEALSLESEFAEYAGAQYCLLTHSGTSALQIALLAHGIGKGDEVIVPAYSFIATALAVLLAEATPIFVDINITTGTIDPNKIKAAITDNTRAIMPVHIHGGAADMEKILAIAKAHNLHVIEDAAQAHGTLYQNCPVGSLGSAGGFSLQSSKNLAAGEGGLFITNNETIALEANYFRNFGQNLQLSQQPCDLSHPLDSQQILLSHRVGAMYRGNEMMAAIAREQLKKLKKRTSQCQANAKKLSNAFSQLPGVILPSINPGSTSVYHKYCIRLDCRGAGVSLPTHLFRQSIMQALRAEGMELALWQNSPLPAHPIFTSTSSNCDNYNPNNYPATQEFLNSCFMLFSQSYPLIAQEEATINKYIEAFRKVWNHRVEIAEKAAATQG